jgi:hypothetical protein
MVGVSAAAVCAVIAWLSFGRPSATDASAARAGTSSSDGSRLRADRESKTVARAPVLRSSSPALSDDDVAGDQQRATASANGGGLWFVDGADPCEPVAEATLSADMETVSAAGVTVAWPPTVEAIEPTALAHVVAGLLEEAALLTDSDRRARLTVVLHPTVEELRLATGAPRWASGIYDGAVHVVAYPKRDFGVRLDELRHEVMHAQLHTAAGCTPAWLNEGTAMYFAGRPSPAGWTKILRDKAFVGIGVLSTPTVVDLPEDEAGVAYAQSLAMVLYAIESAKEGRLDEVLQSLRARDATAPRQRAESLWSVLYPRIGPMELRGWLGRRILGATSDREIEDAFSGAVCCTSSRRISGYACHAAPLRPGQSSWADANAGEDASCRAEAALH